MRISAYINSTVANGFPYLLPTTNPTLSITKPPRSALAFGNPSIETPVSTASAPCSPFTIPTSYVLHNPNKYVYGGITSPKRGRKQARRGNISILSRLVSISAIPRPAENLTDALYSSNLLYPKEDRATSQLLFVCKACHATQMFDNACTYRHHLGSTVTETAGVTTDVANDPTVRDDSLMLPCFCTMCGDQIRCGRRGESALEESDVSDTSSQEGDGGDQT
jgi:DNA-directed RNA polymerase subunit M/transcription elongation factor TFIIS